MQAARAFEIRSRRQFPFCAPAKSLYGIRTPSQRGPNRNSLRPQKERTPAPRCSPRCRNFSPPPPALLAPLLALLFPWLSLCRLFLWLCFGLVFCFFLGSLLRRLL